MAKKWMLGLCVIAVFWGCGGRTPSLPQVNPAGPEDLFEKYVALEHGFDPAVSTLYDDAAVIINKRKYLFGEKMRQIPAPLYKSMIVQMMPLAKARKDTSQYQNVTLNAEGGMVRIRATRYSGLKKYSSPLSLLVGRDASGNWRIFEERSESQP